MRRYFVLNLALMLSIYILGCGKKEQPLEELQAPMSIESLSTMTQESKVAPATQTMPEAGQGIGLLPPAGPYQPTAIEIQTALKNANFYAGAIDGKIGPQTRKAIEEFQKANALESDGKVGPKTWAVLVKYLNPQPAAPAKKGKR